MNMEKSFKQSVIEGLKYYVYALVDPSDNRIFYVGKGSGNRVYQHARAALVDDSPSLKLSTIREIKELGLDVMYYIIRHNLTEQEAYLVESSIMDLLTYPAFNKENILTNIVSGHHQWNEGIKTDEEINILYDCPKIKPIPGDRLLLVSLNKSYKQSKATGVYRRANDYESARKYWKLSRDKADKVKYILGIYRGIVRIVIEVKGKSLCPVAEDGTVFKEPRFAFVGDIVPDSPYLNTDVTDYTFGSGGAITYIPRTNF
ncbi:MAG: endonuclease [Lactobacillus sp.]|nr:endonuclease [Lactobacillus sp.]